MPLKSTYDGLREHSKNILIKFDIGSKVKGLRAHGVHFPEFQRGLSESEVSEKRIEFGFITLGRIFSIKTK